MAVALEVDGNRQAADMGRIGFNMHGKCRYAAAQTLRADTGLVDVMQQFFF